MNRPLTVAALLLSIFIAAMEATVVSTAMPTIISDLGGISAYGWVGSSYLLASTVSVPVYGKIADLYGRKHVLLFGIALFLVGSVCRGLSSDIWFLIGARIVQGLGAGAMQPITTTIIGDIFTIEERGRIQGVFGAVWAVAGVAGPLVGGAIVKTWSWPWVFYINIPFGIGSAIMLIRYFKEKEREKPNKSIDWLGASVLLTASVCILLAASKEQPFFTAPAGILLFVAFAFIERRAQDPVLPFDVIGDKRIAIAVIAFGLLGATMMASIMFVPLYGEGVRQLSPTAAGSAVAPMLVGWPIASALTSRLLPKIGFRAPVWLGSIMVLFSLLAFVLALGQSPPLVLMQVLMFLYGFGMGLANTTLIIAIQSAVPWNRRGVATAASMFSRSMGGAIGVGALGSLLGEFSTNPEDVALLAKAINTMFWAVFGVSVANMVAVSFYPPHAATTAVVEVEPP